MYPGYSCKIGTFALLSLALMSACADRTHSEDSLFRAAVLKRNAEGAAPWAKFVGDLNADGKPEFIVGYHDSGVLEVFSSSADVAAPVAPAIPILTDGGVADLNGDGINDLVLLTEQGVMAFASPDFRPVPMLPGRLHDVLFLDEDSDGALEVVVRNQTAFGSGSGDVRILKRSPDSAAWSVRTLYRSDGEGMAVDDVDGDGDSDIVVGAVWLENAGVGSWEAHRYTSAWNWPHAKVAIADIDGDGLKDIVLAPAEPVNERYKIAWYQQSNASDEEWPEHILVSDIESVVHALQAGDADLDGDVDIVYAEMHQGDDPDVVAMLENRRNGKVWEWRLVGEGGSHNLQLFDWDADGDLDIGGANWRGQNTDVMLWENTVCDAPWTHWDRHVIDDDRPGRAVFVLAGDLNGDTLPDIVSGSRAYLNPGFESEAWRAVSLGTPATDSAALWDIDRDGDLDVLVAVNDSEPRRFELRINDGDGRFDAAGTGVPLSGDFLQGTALLNANGRKSLALSWHEDGHGIEMLSPPAAPGEPWSVRKATNFAQDEGLSAGDIDGDGDLDLLTGTSWVRNDPAGWTVQAIDEASSAPDRNVLADVDGDGDVDAVVGFEAISAEGEIVWYESQDGGWRRHLIGRIVGPMSLDVVDIDRDGDLDVISGEHNLKAPESASLWIFENVDGAGTRWEPRLIHVGDEHHDGTQAVDVDFDGDMDIVSIGWGHNRVLWYENKMPLCTSNLGSDN